MLVPHLIEYASKKARQLCPDVSIGLQTNASLMDEKAIKLIKKFGLQTGVSLDGDLSVQESLRGKAGATFKGLHLLEKNKVPFNVTTVVTKANADKLHRLVLLLGGFSMARGIGLDPLVLKGNAKKNAVLQAGHAQIKLGIKKMLQALDMVNAFRQIPLVIREMEKLRQKRGKEDFTHFCHAALGQSLAVTSDGKLFPCSQTANDLKFYLGTLDHPESWKHSLELGSYALNHASGDMCADCSLNKSSCPGDCPSRLYYNQNDSPGLACTIYQTLASHMDTKIDTRTKIT